MVQPLDCMTQKTYDVSGINGGEKMPCEISGKPQWHSHNANRFGFRAAENFTVLEKLFVACCFPGRRKILDHGITC